MVTSVNNRIGKDCQGWIDTLRADRILLNKHRSDLQELVEKGHIPHDDMPAVDHFDNQIEIQLTNINHLKHDIKDHLLGLEMTPSEQLSAPHLIVHENLSDRFRGLSVTIGLLKQEFSEFCRAIQAGH